jgi:hypothetical protein
MVLLAVNFMVKFTPGLSNFSRCGLDASTRPKTLMLPLAGDTRCSENALVVAMVNRQSARNDFFIIFLVKVVLYTKYRIIVSIILVLQTF